MLKWLIIGGVVLGLAAGVGAVMFFSRESVKTANQTVTEKLAEASSTGPTNIDQYDFLRSEFEKILEASFSAINAKIDSTNKRIDDLSKTKTSAVTTIQPSTSTTTTATSVGAKSVYIPIGTGGSSTSTTGYESIGVQEVTIDTANYPGYKSMVFEAYLRIYQGNGTAFARLQNKTDGTAISGTEISSTSQDFGIISSGTFTLPSGSKKYTVQLKTSTGYSADLQTARIRVDF